MQNLIGIGIADTIHQARIGERSLEGVIFGCKRLAKRIDIAGKNVDSSCIQRMQVCLAAEDMQRRPPLGTGFGEY